MPGQPWTLDVDRFAGAASDDKADVAPAREGLRVISLRPDVAGQLPGSGDLLERVMALQGEVYRNTGGRRTVRVELGGSGYFLKAHCGVGWLEVFKNLTQFKMPVLGARSEWQALERLAALGLPTMTLAGYGERGWNPARIRSFILTDELTEVVSLEQYCADWPGKVPFAGARLRLKRALICKVADVARTLHRNGLNHRDFYICHLLLDVAGGDPLATGASPRLILIDLHRAQCRARTPRRLIIKDLAALLFSVKDLGLTRRDRLRFVRAYGAGLRSELSDQRRFWRAIERRAARLEARLFRIGDGIGE